MNNRAGDIQASRIRIASTDEIAASPLTTVADVGEAGMAAAAIEAALDGG